MFGRTSFAIVAALGALLLAAPASADKWGADRLLAEQALTHATAPAPERVIHDRFPLEPTATITTAPIAASSREIEWPQLGIGLGLGLLLGLGLVLGTRLMHVRPPVAR